MYLLWKENGCTVRCEILTIVASFYNHAKNKQGTPSKGPCWSDACEQSSVALVSNYFTYCQQTHALFYSLVYTEASHSRRRFVRYTGVPVEIQENIPKGCAFNILASSSPRQGKHNQASRPLVRLSIDLANSSSCGYPTSFHLLGEHSWCVVCVVGEWVRSILPFWSSIVLFYVLKSRWTLEGQGQKVDDVIARAVLWL